MHENILTRELPIVPDDDTLIAKNLSVIPEYHKSVLLLPAIRRVQELRRLKEVFIATPRHGDLYLRIDRLIRDCYDKDLNNPKTTAALKNNLDELTSHPIGELIPFPNQQHSPRKLVQGINLLGDAGSGKTSSLVHILSQYPQTIEHGSFTQVVYVYVQCPADGSLKAFGLQALQILSDLTGKDYLSFYGGIRSSAETLLWGFNRAAGMHQLGLLIMDEIQHLNCAKSGGATKMLNSLTNFKNALNVPVVLVGLPESEIFLSLSESHARRGPMLKFGPMGWDEWLLLVKKIWRFRYTKAEIPFSDELIGTLWDETQGVPDYTVRVWSCTQEKAIMDDENEEDVVTPDIMRAAAQEELELCQKQINRLRKKNEAQALYPICTPAPATRLVNEETNQESTVSSQLPADNDIVGELVRTLAEFNIDETFALQCAQQAMVEVGTPASLHILRRHALNLAENRKGNQSKSKSKKKGSSNMPKDDGIRLIDIVENGLRDGKHPHDALAQAGLTISFGNWFSEEEQEGCESQNVD